jgi:hypothetical protein
MQYLLRYRNQQSAIRRSRPLRLASWLGVLTLGRALPVRLALNRCCSCVTTLLRSHPGRIALHRRRRRGNNVRPPVQGIANRFGLLTDDVDVARGPVWVPLSRCSSAKE